jgi:fibrillarin-like rRNA methylase
MMIFFSIRKISVPRMKATIIALKSEPFRTWDTIRKPLANQIMTGIKITEAKAETFFLLSGVSAFSRL